MKPMSEFLRLRASIAFEYRWSVGRKWKPLDPPLPKSEDRRNFADVKHGDGKQVEAIAAVMWHCAVTDEEAEEAIDDYIITGRPLI